MTWKKIVPLGFMMFCILFNYTILRDTKDVLVVTAPGSGAEIIPFLKTWVNLPMAIGFTILYAKVSSFSRQQFQKTLLRVICFSDLHKNKKSDFHSVLYSNQLCLLWLALQCLEQRAAVLHMHFPLHCFFWGICICDVSIEKRSSPNW